MRLRIKDATYDVDESRITVAEAKMLKRSAGMTVFDFRNGLAQGDPDAAIFLMWLAKSREGEKVNWSSFDDYDMVSDVEIILDDEPGGEKRAEADGDGGAAEGGADPTRDGSTRTGAATSTSRRSRSTSDSTRAKSTG